MSSNDDADESKIEELEKRIDEMEAGGESDGWSVQDLTQLGLTRREALYILGAIAAGYTFREAFLRATAPAEAGSKEVGAVGTADKPVDIFVEDLIGPEGVNPVTFLNDIQAGSGKLNIQTGMSTPAVDTGQLSVRDAGDTARIAQMAVDGAIVPVAPGLGAGDAIPVSDDNPLNDAISDVATAGGGYVILPPEPISQLNPITTKTKVGIRGCRGASQVNLDSTAGSLFRTDGGDVREAVFCDFKVNGAGVGSHTADCLDLNTGRWIDCSFERLQFGNVQGQAFNFEAAPGFQTKFTHIRWSNIDAGAENAVFEWDGGAHAPLSFANWAVYPDDTASGADSTIFIDSVNNAAEAQVSLHGYMNIGGTAGTFIERNYNNYVISATVNWEPSTQNSTPADLIQLRRARPFKFFGNFIVDGTVTDVYACDFNSGLVELPNLRVKGTINGDVVEVEDQSDTIEYGGVSGDVNNASGGALAPGVACKGDLTLVT